MVKRVQTCVKNVETQNQVTRQSEVIWVLNQSRYFCYEPVNKVNQSQTKPNCHPSQNHPQWVADQFWTVLVKFAHLVATFSHWNASNQSEPFDVLEDEVDPVQFVLESEAEHQPDFGDDERESEGMKVSLGGKDEKRNGQQGKSQVVNDGFGTFEELELGWTVVIDWRKSCELKLSIQKYWRTLLK